MVKKKNVRTAAKNTSSKNGKASAPAFKKTACPVSRKEFAESAPAITAVVGDAVVHAGSKVEFEGREFSSGSLGWYINGTIEVMVNGKPCKCNVGINVVLSNSKELPR